MWSAGGFTAFHALSASLERLISSTVVTVVRLRLREPLPDFWGCGAGADSDAFVLLISSTVVTVVRLRARLVDRRSAWVSAVSKGSA
ncbi:hypothetical protein CYQ11_20115 [Streptomyces cinnamoneus]|nr:hypothetical protein CYQ11_20115 [Streptomyces cinnamoneus]